MSKPGLPIPPDPARQISTNEPRKKKRRLSAPAKSTTAASGVTGARGKGAKIKGVGRIVEEVMVEEENR